MKLLVIGDVHGCYYTLKELVQKNWKPKKEILIQVGDLINKGPYSAKCLQYWKTLQDEYPDQVFLIRGNHEQKVIDYFVEDKLDPFIPSLLQNLEEEGLKPREVFNWLSELPLKWESDGVCITHAGISKTKQDPFTEKNPNGVLYNRKELRNIKKGQVVGHIVVKGSKPIFSPSENAWYIDTGVWIKKYLSALKISSEGVKVKVIKEERSYLDNKDSSGYSCKSRSY